MLHNPILAAVAATVSMSFLIFHVSSATATSVSASASASASASVNVDSDQKQKKNKNKRMAREFLDAHNAVRQIYRVPPLRWDKNLARSARRWAAKRKQDCELVHSEADSEYGENLFWSQSDSWTPERLVRSWADEVADFDLKSLECSPEKMCGHFTQVVWRDTTMLGCARVECDNLKGWLSVCHYKPPGNWPDESPFGGPKVKS